MNSHIYADNAATTKLDEAAFEAMLPFLTEEYGNASQPYAFARRPKKALARARETIAECIGALPDEIYFTSGGTESDNWAIKSSAVMNPNKKETVTSAFEHHAVLNSCAAMERLGYPIVYLRPTNDGYITPADLNDHVTGNTGLVSVMFANNEIGTIQPIEQLCEVAHSFGVLFHTDAVQAVGHIPLDVHKLGVDFLSASGHKFNGPKGVGFLFIRKGINLISYADGGAQERAHRAGTENVAAIAGMAAALKTNCDGVEQNEKHISKLEGRIISRLNESGVAYKRNGGVNRLPGLMSLSFPGKEGEAILHRMDLAGISISTGSACDGENTKTSHVLQAIGLDEFIAKGTVRISLGKSNTMEEAEKIAAALVKIVG